MGQPLLQTFLTVTAGAVGATIGSFLNVCIYRVPLPDLSINEPRRSFCPNCKSAIPWWLNIPVLSWIFLLGECKNCKQPISFRYPFVELLTAALFVLVWVRFGQPATHWPIALAYWILMALLVTVSFIDIDHFIIPDSLSVGGAVTGMLASLLVPTLMGADNHLHALSWSIFGAFVGYGVLWSVITLGKLAFGRRKLRFDNPAPWKLSQPDESPEPILQIEGEDDIPWTDIFFRQSDRLNFGEGEIAIDGAEPVSFQQLKFAEDRFWIDGREHELEKVKLLEGNLKQAIISREAMGFGDAKLEACIGAFLGWKAVFFSLFAGAFLGTVVWLVMRLLGRAEMSRKIPFGPYLAAGALVWLFQGPRLVDWYFGLLRGPAY